MLRGYRFKANNGRNLSVVETDTPGVVSVAIHTEEGAIIVVELSQEDWYELCDLKYSVKVKEKEDSDAV